MRAVPVLASMCAAVALLVGPVSALAASPTVEHFEEAGTFIDPDFCGTGTAVDGSFDISGTNLLTPNHDIAFKQTAEAKYSYTNPDSGATVLVHAAGAFIIEAISSTATGSTLLVSNLGLPEQIRTPHGRVLTRDAGYLQLLLTLDDDGQVVGSEIVIDRGPHPDAEADLALFCAVTTTALGL
jgi:hypothetical protein